MSIPHKLMKGRCRFCGRTLRYANIPNRGPVMAHAKGERERCNRLIIAGQDLVSRAERQEEAKAARDAARAKTKARVKEDGNQ